MSSIPPSRKAPPPDRPLNVGALGIHYPSPIKTQAPDWDFWRGMRKVLHWQACALSVGADPDTMGRRPGDSVWSYDAHHLDQLPKSSQETLKKRLRLLAANRYERTIFTLPMTQYSGLNTSEVFLSEFAAWGVSLGWHDMPPELSAMAQGRTAAPPESAAAPRNTGGDGDTTLPFGPEDTYFHVHVAAIHMAARVWPHENTEFAKRKLKARGIDPMPDYPLDFIRLLELPQLEEKIEALLANGKIPLYEWPSRIRTSDRTDAYINEAELIALLMAGAHLTAPVTPADLTASTPQTAPASEPVTCASVPSTRHRLRTNSLDVPIKKAITEADSFETGAVYLQLREMALSGELPFSGEIEDGALCYTNDAGKPDKLTKNALGKRLKKHRLCAVSRR